MLDELFSGKPKKCETGEAFNLLQELESNTSDELLRQRTHFRIRIKSPLILLPGNASDSLKFKLKGTTGDLSQGGCQALFPMPVIAGDLYRLVFDRDTLDLPMAFAQCMRCRLLRENAFEVGFRFFTPVTLPKSLVAMVESN